MTRLMVPARAATIARPLRVGRLLTLIAFAGLFTSACDVHGISKPGTLTTLRVSPDPQTLAVNATQQFTAVGTDFSGAVVPVTPVWSIVAGGGAISSSGMFTAGTVPGTFVTVKATQGGHTSTATVTVTAGPLAAISIAPDPASLQIGTAQQFAAVGTDAWGNVVPITPTWTVIAGGGAIDANGRFTAGDSLGRFTNTVRASSGALAATATVDVVAGPLATLVVSPNPATMDQGAMQRFTAVGRDARGNSVAVTPLWAVVAGGGMIDSVGMFTAGDTAGTFNGTVRATSGAISATATVVVNPDDAPSNAGVPLGTAASAGILAGTSVSCVTTGTVNGDIGIWPGSDLVGFGPCVANGKVNLGNAIASQQQQDLGVAYQMLADLPCPPDNAIVADLGGTTKPAGVYCTGSGIGVTGTLTLDGGGDPNAVFVFQAGSGLTTAGDVVLINGANASNVFWQVGSSATIGTASQWQGNILAHTSITLVDGATLFGRALAQNGAVTLGTANTITVP